MKFYGQFGYPVDKFIYDRYFRGRRVGPGMFVECGAFDGTTECSCKFFEESLNWSGINIEASPLLFKALKINRPHATNINVALSDVTGTATFQHVIHPTFGQMCTNGSLTHLPLHKQMLLDGGCHFQECEVQTITWEGLCLDNNISKVDLLVLDVEGHELQVLKGMRGCNVLPDIICVEHGHLGVRKLKELLCPLGYYYDTSSFVNSFFLRSSGRLSDLYQSVINSLRQRYFTLKDRTIRWWR